MRLRKKLTMAALTGVMISIALGAINTPTASAATSRPPSLGYCGPAFTSKSAMISWLQSHPHPYQRSKAEAYVRKHARYYHIRADQSFIAWLTMPNIKFKRAPAGYVLNSNTGCDNASNVVPYSGRLGVSNLPMLWWCNDPTGTGYNCTPVAKYYCRNWVTGKMVFPAVPKAPRPTRPAPKPVVNILIGKSTPNFSGRGRFGYRVWVNGRLYKATVKVANDGQLHKIGAAPAYATVKTCEYQVKNWRTVGTLCRTKKAAGRNVVFRYTNYLTALITTGKFTFVDGRSTTCTATPCSTAESFVFGLRANNTNRTSTFKLPNDGKGHSYWGYVGTQYTLYEKEGHGYTVSYLLPGEAKERSGNSVTFTLTAKGFVVSWVNRRSTAVAPKPAPPAVPTTPVIPAPKGDPNQVPPQSGGDREGTGQSPPAVDPGPGSTLSGPPGGSSSSDGGGGSLPVPTPGNDGYDTTIPSSP